jgi:hypothetical protein
MRESETSNYEQVKAIEMELSKFQGHSSCLTEPTLFPGREADHSLSSSAEVKNDGAIPPLPIRLHGAVMN